LKFDVSFAKLSKSNIFDIGFTSPVFGLSFKDSYVNLPLSPPPRKKRQRQRQRLLSLNEQHGLSRKLRSSCVRSARALKKQVKNCRGNINDKENPCIINICSKVIKIANQLSINSSDNMGIDLTNKSILMSCRLRQPHRCKLDGQGLSRIFYGTNTTVTFRNIVFVNGYSSTSGGAFMITNGSTVNAWNCSFVNNSASHGSAISVDKTELIIDGTKTSFINNTGDTPPLFLNASYLELTDALFKWNNATQYVSTYSFIFICLASFQSTH
jgi:hypothetical protein